MFNLKHQTLLKRLVVMLPLALLALSTTVTAASVSGTITENTTWTAASSPYIITGHITVNSGVTLTIEPGVTVKADAGKSIILNGSLSAVGTSSSPILISREVRAR